MKILQIIQRPQTRGAEIFACQLAVCLQQMGHEVVVLFLFGQDKFPLDYPLSFQFLNASHSKGWLDFSGYNRLAKYIKNEKFDVIQANAGDTLRYACLSKWLFGFEGILVFRNANKMSDFLTSLPKKWLYRLLLCQVNGVASVSENCRIDFLQLFKPKNMLVEYLPIGVDFHTKPSYASWSQAGLPHFQAPVLLHVGSFVPEKNHVGLLRIFRKVLIYYPQASLLLIGKGKEQATIMDMAKDLGEERVFFAGSRSDVLSIMPLCNALLMPSKIEGLPGVILEAQMCRLPVVAYDVGGIGEVVRNGETGYLVNKGDEDYFVQCLLELLSSKPSDMVDQAAQLVEKYFDNNYIASKFEMFYQQLMSITKN